MTPPDNRAGVRTWRLRWDDEWRVVDARHFGVNGQTSVGVIELDPVLDLLERCAKAIDVKPSGQPWRTRLDVDRFLAAHNRGQS